MCVPACWFCRPNVPADLLLARCGTTKVCYSHWVLSSMAILNKLAWIDATALTRFILSAQVCFALRRLARVFWLSCVLRSDPTLGPGRRWHSGPPG